LGPHERTNERTNVSDESAQDEEDAQQDRILIDLNKNADYEAAVAADLQRKIDCMSREETGAGFSEAPL